MYRIEEMTRALSILSRVRFSRFILFILSIPV